MRANIDHGAAGEPARDEGALHRRVVERTRYLLAEAAAWLHIATPNP